ncbi:MAG: pinensin family lanthipeptide, partial [Cyclobacteriaceae bacterium]
TQIPIMKKYSLKDLKVESFVTEVSAGVKGGAEAATPYTEYVSCNPTCGIRVDKNGNPYC